jgi:hypothetical protein
MTLSTRSKIKPVASVTAEGRVSDTVGAVTYINVTWPAPPASGQRTSSLLLYRDEVLLDTLSATARSYSDTTADTTSHSYAVAVVAGSATSLPTRSGNVLKPTRPVWSGVPTTLYRKAGGGASFATYVSDANGGAFTYSLVSPPSGYSINSSTGQVSIGTTNATLTIRATDSTGLYADTSVQIRITSPPARRLPAGHWTTMLRGNRSQSSMSARLVNGVTRVMQKRYTWRQLEPTLGNYSFVTNPGTDELTSDLAWAASNGILLVPMIEDKTFSNSEMPGPAYMDAYTVEASNGDRFVARWDPYYVERFNALQTAIATAFDSNAAFGGISTQETAMGSPTDAQLGIGSAVPAGKAYLPYTTARYRDRQIEVIQHHATVFPNTYLWWHSNFIRDNFSGSIIGEIVEAVKAGGNFSLGGPDILPGSNSLETRFYWLYTLYRGQFPLLIEAQVDSYSHPDGGPFNTMTEIFEYARDDLFANIVVWTYLGGPTETGGNDYADAIPVMQANPTFNENF